MKFLDSCLRLFCRFKYPISLPEDVATALGVSVSNFVPFDLLIKTVSANSTRPKSLKKYMPRREAEQAFKAALKVERHRDRSIYSYYSNNNWVEFSLVFDQDGRLRHLFMKHNDSAFFEKGIEIPLDTTPFYQITESLLN